MYRSIPAGLWASFAVGLTAWALSPATASAQYCPPYGAAPPGQYYGPPGPAGGQYYAPPPGPPMSYPATANPNCFPQQQPPPPPPPITPVCNDCPRMYHYPFYYFPHNYWPTNSPQWPEPPGKCYMPPPAYMAFPPYKEPNWRYEYWEPQRFYRGSHFLLDIF